MPRLRPHFVLLALLSLSIGLHAGDWPGFRGPNGDGTADDKNLNKDWTAHPPKTLWTVPMTDGGLAAPAVAGGRVFIVDHKGPNDVVRALDLATGKDLWSFPYAEASKDRHGFTESAPVVDAKNVYTFSKLGKVHALDAATGKLLWMHDVIKEFNGRRPEWDYASSPALIDKQLIIGTGGDGTSVIALEPATGKLLWKSGNSLPAYATPVGATLNGNAAIVTFIAEGLVGLDSASGQRLWSYPWPIDFDQNSATPIVRGNTILFSTAWNKGTVMLDVTDNKPKVLWQTKDMQCRFPSPVITHARIYGTHDGNNSLVCLEAATGKLLWKKPILPYASLLAVDDALIVLDSKTGNIILLDATVAEYKELGRIAPGPTPGADAWTAPVLADGKLLVRGTKALACVNLAK